MILDAAWVVGSVALIMAGVLTRTGNWLVATVADIVLVFGLVQFNGIRQLRHEKIGQVPQKEPKT